MNFLDSRLPRKFWKKVSPCPMSGCWLWTGFLNRGYGHVRYQRRYERVHRVAYIALVGPIKDGLTLDHLCEVKCCVNPAHLEPCTSAENTRRITVRHPVTHCPRGHEKSGSNLYVKSNGERICKPCQDRAVRARADRLRATGMCVTCGSKPIETGRTSRCAACAAIALRAS